jgi:hypothetical protein
MSATIINEPSVDGAIHGAFLTPLMLPESLPHFSLEITASGLSYHLDAPLIGDPAIAENEFVAKFAVDKNVILIVTLIGEWSGPGAEFRATRYLLNCRLTEPRARAQFIRSTVLAILGFSGKIGLKIPELGIDTYLLFDLPLQEISHQLQLRQLAYRLLIIERATGKEFSIPETSSSQEIDYANRVYHAIVDRSFVGPIDPVEHVVPAVNEALAWLESYEGITKQTYGPLPASTQLFNQTISLGNARIIVDDAYVVEADRVRSELSANDGHLVRVVISSLSGQGVYETPEAPHLASLAWDSTVDLLISLEEQLDESLAKRYHALAASTLATVPPDKRAELTARPELDPEAFSLDD